MVTMRADYPFLLTRYRQE